MVDRGREVGAQVLSLGERVLVRPSFELPHDREAVSQHGVDGGQREVALGYEANRSTGSNP